MAADKKPEEISHLLDTPGLAETLEDDRFKQFLDHMPVAIAVAELQPSEHVVYCNVAFERICERPFADIIGQTWDFLDVAESDPSLGQALVGGQDSLGVFPIGRATTFFNVWSSLIENQDGTPVFRLVAIASLHDPEDLERAAVLQKLQDKDVLLRELQHRVKNNLQMITALIRMEARNVPREEERFDRLAGRVQSLALLYQSLSEQGVTDEIDLGIYLSQVASAMMGAQAVEGIRLDLKVDTWPVSINVAMPTGLAVTELLMNSLKHGFAGRDGGTIMLHSLVDKTGCRIVIADDGIGLPENMEWPQRGKLSFMILKSLRENAGANVEVQSRPGQGMRVVITFRREDAAANLPVSPFE